MRQISLFFIVMATPFLLAQDGTRVYEFLNTTTSPRQAALGGNAQSMWDSDPNTTLWNPALMNHKNHNQLSTNYTNYIADIHSGSMSYIYQLDKDNFFSIHGQYINYGKFQYADYIGNVNGNFSANDAALIIGYARKLSDLFTVGLNTKFIYSNIESYNSYGGAIDLGVVFHDIDYNTNITLVTRNIGYQLKPYDGKNEPLPLQINLGVSHKLEHVPIEVTATLHDLQKYDISEQVDKDNRKISNIRKIIDHLSMGVEFFPERNFNARLGYNFKKGNELNSDKTKNFSGISAGFGIKYNAFRLDYAHTRYNSSTNSNHIGISVDLESFIDSRHY